MDFGHGLGHDGVGTSDTECKKLTCFLTSFKNQLVLAKAFLPVYPTQTKPKPKSRKSRQLEMAANKPGQKSMKDFFNSSFSVKNEPGKAGLGQTLRVFLLKNSFNLENGVGLVNVAKTEPLNRSRKRKLNSCENEDRSGQNAKVSYQIKSWSFNILFKGTGSNQNKFKYNSIYS